MLGYADRTANLGGCAVGRSTTMQGLGMGQGDYHYGNNAILPPSHAFVVTVGVNGQPASLSFQRPAGG